MSQPYSISPDGTQYPLPTEEDYKKEYIRVEKLVNNARKKGQEIVVVMGVGFVGAVMAAIVADTEFKPPSTNHHQPSTAFIHQSPSTIHYPLPFTIHCFFLTSPFYGGKLELVQWLDIFIVTTILSNHSLNGMAVAYSKSVHSLNNIKAVNSTNST